ncbi:MAG: oligoribonuclease [Omnitrophica bacterium RIFCSPHIGHO2_02_FULL_51_18]|nr:MAG: oligoribonuclease [Omnitrophica bacterium RIFCSPHIGHO2_02_FULL_51_18]
MTGLDPKKCTILEIGTVITDNELTVVAEGPAIAIRHGDKILNHMEAWSRHHHEKSGLTDACRESKISLKAAEKLTLEFVRAFCKEKTAPLCGNTIWQDRRFLVKYMPKLESYFHYRMIDVSSVKELVQRWYPKDHKMPREKKQTHRVKEDIFESMDELRYYRKKVFITSLQP